MTHHDVPELTSTTASFRNETLSRAPQTEVPPSHNRDRALAFSLASLGIGTSAKGPSLPLLLLPPLLVSSSSLYPRGARIGEQDIPSSSSLKGNTDRPETKHPRESVIEL